MKVRAFASSAPAKLVFPLLKQRNFAFCYVFKAKSTKHDFWGGGEGGH